MTASSQRFDTIASNYASSEVHRDSPSIRRVHALLEDADIDSVCDVACGAGHFGLSFAGKAARLVAVDPARNMLACATTLAAAAQVALEVVESTAEQIPLASGQFDLVMTRLAAHHFYSVPEALAEMARLAKPGGHVVAIDLEGFDDGVIDDINHRLEVLHDPTHVRSYTASQWQAWFEQAGLQISHVDTDGTERPQGVPVSRWCDIAGSGAAAKEDIIGLLDALPDAARAALRIRRNPQGEYLMPVRTVTIVARKCAA